MHRSVVQLGNKTHVVSLPAEWMRRFGVRKGHPLKVEEKGESLVVTPLEGKKGEVLSVDVTGVPRSVKRILGAAYKAGFDEIEVRYAAREERIAIEDALRESLRSLGVVSESDGCLRIKNLAEFRHEEFETVLRRLFLLLLQSSDTFAREGTRAAGAIAEREREINDCADQCRRSLIRKGYERTTPALYAIIEQLEKIGDRLRDAAQSEPGARFSDWAAAFRSFYELFYGFEIHRFDAWMERMRSIKEGVHNEKNRLLVALAEDLFDLNGTLLVCKLSA